MMPRVLAALLPAFVLCLSCHAMTAGAPQSTPPAVSPASITEIALELRCFGCDRESRITLRRDGTATKTAFGNARRGVSDRTFTGSIAVSVFEDLARRMVAEGFFQLDAAYRDPQLADGESRETTVVLTGSQKRVLDANRKGPAALQRIEALIDVIGNAVAWKDASPDPPGARASETRPALPQIRA